MENRQKLRFFRGLLSLSSQEMIALHNVVCFYLSHLLSPSHFAFFFSSGTSLGLTMDIYYYTYIGSSLIIQGTVSLAPLFLLSTYFLSLSM